MALQLSDTARNASLEAIETTLAASPVMELRTGAAPANVAAAATGTLLVSINLPADAFANASGGTKALQGTWQAAASAAGTVGHFRLRTSGGTYHAQGSVTATGGGGDLTLDNTNVAASQVVTVTAFNITAGGN